MATRTAADRIRMKQRYLHLLSDLLDNFKDYLNEVARKKFGDIPRFVVLTNVNAVEKVGSKGLQLVKADFHSELGNLNLTIAIKEFSSGEEALRNISLTNLIKKRLVPLPRERMLKVSTPRVLMQHGATLIYEGIQGESFTESNIDYFQKLGLAGLALSKYHSADIKSASPKRYLHLLKSVLAEIPIPAERRNKYFNQAADILEKLDLFNCGTAGFGDFHQENLMFSEVSDNGKKYTKSWLIDPEYAEGEEARVDRMEDIATFFLHTAISYYSREKDLKKLKNDLEYFFKGYNSYLRIHQMTLNKIYGNAEKSFCFHLGLNSLLEGLFAVKKGIPNDQATLDRTSLCLALASHCWTNGLN
ncbi:MAG: hypothetical protein ACFFD4_21855 [Candidatus Odinarchaeota archaeon]